MIFRNKMLMGGLLAVFMGTGQAYAVDIPPPPEQTKDSCFYARIDGGYSFHERPDITKNNVTPVWGGTNSATDEEIDDNFFIEGGVGCRVWKNVRIDATIGYRDGGDMSEAFGGLDGELETLYGFVNVYYDIITWGRLTPYVGGGIGWAHHRINGITLPPTVDDGENFDFAWNLQAGVAVDLTTNIALDVGYRFADLGSAKSGSNPDRLQVDKIHVHDIRVGLRYSFKDW